MIKVMLIFGLYLGLGGMIGLRRSTWFFWPIILTMVPHIHVYMNVGGGYKISLDVLIPLVASICFMASTGVSVLRPRLMDFLAIGLVVCNIISFFANNSFTPYLPIMMTLTSLPCYLLGRSYLRDTRDLFPMLQSYSVAITLIAGMAMFESVTHQAIVQRLFGWGSVSGIRYGLMRAMLGMANPLGLITLTTVLAAPSFEAARWGREGLGPRWWRHLPLIVMGGLMAGVSRSSVQCILLLCLGRLFFERPALRIPLVVGLTTILLIVLTNLELVLEYMDKYEDKGGGRVTEVLINGETRLYSSARHRLLLYDVYREKMQEAGAFGFDRTWYGTLPAHLRNFNSVDDFYIQQRLTRGLVGLLLADLLLVTTIVLSGRFAIRHWDRPPSGLAAGLATCVFTLALLFFTIPSTPESLGVLLWASGLASSLPLLGYAPPYQEEEEEEAEDDDYDEGGVPLDFASEG